jgi:hypothetical protein
MGPCWYDRGDQAILLESRGVLERNRFLAEQRFLRLLVPATSELDAESTTPNGVEGEGVVDIPDYIDSRQRILLLQLHLQQ